MDAKARLAAATASIIAGLAANSDYVPASAESLSTGERLDRVRQSARPGDAELLRSSAAAPAAKNKMGQIISAAEARDPESHAAEIALAIAEAAEVREGQGGSVAGTPIVKDQPTASVGKQHADFSTDELKAIKALAEAVQPPAPVEPPIHFKGSDYVYWTVRNPGRRTGSYKLRDDDTFEVEVNTMRWPPHGDGLWLNHPLGPAMVVEGQRI